VSFAWETLRSALSERAAARVDASGLRHAAVAIVLRDALAGFEILFIRRAEHPHDPWSGQMAFPGGRSEPGDTDLRATAVRETFEELGLVLERDADYLGALDELRAMARMRPMNLAIAPFVFRLRTDSPLTLSDEVTSAHWLPLDALLSPECRSELEYDYEGRRLQFPCLRHSGVTIWGLTFRMFASLQEVLVPETALGEAAGPR
jgi:8-oxo-dGTP pyrophosphatase MutT (NUDIX family)